MFISSISWRSCVAAFAVLLLSLASTSVAQTGAALLVKPWPEDEKFIDGRAEAFFANSGHIEQFNERFHMTSYESEGRFRILPGNEISPRVGWDLGYLDLHTNTPRLPNQLTDASVAFGSGLFKNGSWIGAMTLGIGYAGDNAFGNGAGWYGKADAILVKQINETDYLGIALDYDGHRTIYPDIPLPGFGYSHRFDPKLQVVAGLPFSSVSWKPIDHLDIELEYAILTDVRFDVSYEFVKHLKAYGLLDYRRDAYHVNGMPKDKRLLFVQHRTEVGLRFDPTKHINVSLGLGYSFDGSFRRGFDFGDNTKKVADYSDEPYLRLGAEMSF